MVIQRLQTIFLFLAAIAMAVFSFMPNASFVTADNVYTWSPLHLIDKTGTSILGTGIYFAVNVLITLLIIISIFLYKNLKRQMTVTLVTSMLVVASCITWFICTKLIAGHLCASTTEWLPGTVLPIISLLLLLIAHRFMGKDRRKLASYDRLR